MPTLHVLVVEDQPDDAELIVLALRRHGIKPTWERVASADELQACLTLSPWDVVLSDYDLPGFGGEAALKIVQAHDPDLPFIVVSGIVGEEVAVAMMRAGAVDYVLKQSLVRLGPAVEREVREAAVRRSQRKAEATLRLRDRAIREVPDGMVITDPNQPDNPLVYVSPAFERLTGYTAAEVIGRNCRFLRGPATDPAETDAIREAVSAGEAHVVELQNYRKNGTVFWNRLAISPVIDESGRLTHFVGLLSDVTERRRMEEQYRQSQKMDAFGQLAGGVAHDFNNMLLVISGYSDLVLNHLSADDPMRELVEEISRASERSASLTRQLLTFSRQQVVTPRLIDTNVVVTDTGRMLARLLGEDVMLELDLRPGVCPVLIDPGQLEQVLLNLAVNARDAMPNGGALTVSTRTEVVRVASTDHPNARPGTYAVLAVSDVGCGMTPEVQSRIFEPFFTTKGVGQGTGLGLATVFGIVQQAGGHIRVTTKLGEGSTFEIYLPQAPTQEPEIEAVKRGQRTLPRGTETVLVVEDDTAVRSLMRVVLSDLGYRVLVAANGDVAMRTAESHPGPIHLMLSDVVMPGTGGRAAAKAVLARHPKMRVLFMSGHLDDAVIRQGVVKAEVPFLQKPFTPSILAHKVRRTLDSR